jgi:hypothetical protein
MAAALLGKISSSTSLASSSYHDNSEPASAADEEVTHHMTGVRHAHLPAESRGGADTPSRKRKISAHDRGQSKRRNSTAWAERPQVIFYFCIFCIL